MDIYRLDSDLKLVNQVGATLNIDERMKLQLALLKLNESEKFDDIKFWGRIDGIAKDYYIAIGLNYRGKFEFPSKKFFWSSNDFNFAELPAINPDHKDRAEMIKAPFSGQQEKILIQLVDPDQPNPMDSSQQNIAPAGGVDSDEEVEIKVPVKNYTELDRLAYVVRAIENDCSLVPVGAFKLTPLHELRYNESFLGLGLEEASKLSSYQHFRNVQSEEKKEFIARDDALFKFDFLDPIEADLPKGSWSIQTDASKLNVTVRNLLWPGYIGYHRAKSGIFGGCYFGAGVKNVDLPFLL